MRAAWDALPEATQTAHRRPGRRAFDLPLRAPSWASPTTPSSERAALPPARAGAGAHDPADRPARALPRLARGRILACRTKKSDELLEELMAHATQRQFVYTHRWRVHDLVMWDNRCTMHRGTEFDERRWKRDMQRATCPTSRNTCEPDLMDVTWPSSARRLLPCRPADSHRDVRSDDVVVVGSGDGSAAAFHLASGQSARAGSFHTTAFVRPSHGQTRIIRRHTSSIRRMCRSCTGHTSSGAGTLVRRDLMRITGGMIGRPDGVLVTGARRSAEQHRLRTNC